MKQVINNKRFYKNTVLQYILQIAKYLFPFVTIPFLTRVFGPELYAVRAYILAAMVFVQVFLDYGFTTYGTRQIARFIDNRLFLRKIVTSIMISRLIVCLLGSIALIPITMIIPIMSEYPLYVAIAYVGVCFKALLPDFIFMGIEDMGIITYRFIVSQALSTILIIVFVRSANELLLVPVFETLAALIAFVWSWQNIIIKRKIYPTRVNFSDITTTFGKATIFFLSSASTTIFTSLTTLMIGIYISNQSEISYWSLAMTVIAGVQALYTPVINSLYPHMAKDWDLKLLRKLLIVGVMIVLVITAMLILFQDFVMMVIGGNEYLEGSYLIALTTPVLLFSYPSMLIGFPILAVCDEEKKLTASSVISASFHIIGLFVLAYLNCFTILNVAILRCLTELLMLILRICFVVIVLKSIRE